MCNEKYVINESDIQFTEDELTLLNKGLNYTLKPKDPPLDDIIVDIETAIKYLDDPTKQTIRKSAQEVISNITNQKRIIKNNNFNKQQKIRKTLKSKQCIYTKADKGNSLVFLNTSDYKNRMEILIKYGKYSKINENPLNKMITSTKLALKNHIDFLESITPYIKWKLIISNPSVPRLYGLPKIHKPGHKMRPIVSNNNSPMENITKFLVSTFKNLIEPVGLYVNNSLEFINLLKTETIDSSEVMVSFDVESLFPSIPIPEALIMLREWIEHQHLTAKEVDTYMDLTTMCMNLNYFQFDYKFYKQNEGSAMGQALSPFIANLFMSNFENNLKTTCPMFPRFWVRYVDDIFVIIKKSKIRSFLNRLNKQHPSIKFTKEEEVDNKLSFLDISVYREDNKFNFGIYRKPTTTSRFIPETSFCNTKHKTAAFNSMIFRACNIPMKPDLFKKEIEYIKEIAKINGYKQEMVPRILKKHISKLKIQNNTTLTPTTETKTINRQKMIFYPYITYKISKIFAKHNIILVNYSNNKLKQCLGSSKDKILDNQTKTGIYEISCKDCKDVYIGQSRRQVKIRFKEHLRHVKNNDPVKSSIAAHILETNHKIDLDNLKLIKEVNDNRKLDAWESLHIEKTRHQKTILNSDLGPINSSLIKFIHKI